MTEDENNLNPQAASPTPAPQQTQPSPVPPAPQVGQGGPVPPSGYTPSQAQPQASGFNGAVQPQAQAQPQPQDQSAPNAYAPYATPPQPASAPAPEKKKSRGWIVAIVVVVALLIVLLVSITSCTSMVKSIVGPSSSGIEITNDANSVAVIDIDGTIQYDGTSNSPEGFKQLLDEGSVEGTLAGELAQLLDRGLGVVHRHAARLQKLDEQGRGVLNRSLRNMGAIRKDEHDTGTKEGELLRLIDGNTDDSARLNRSVNQGLRAIGRLKA